ncbi:hypothetical protein QCA50_011245 [Cerrena zonata]|uniref:Uncharacterized protein n=1 Tax=Cerrena zonata TaxID=2478898 RepID=A0AAW0G1I5_9APHY
MSPPHPQAQPPLLFLFVLSLPLPSSSTDTPSPTHESTESTQLLAIDPSILSSLVRFPPSQVLTHSFPAIPASAYDRSPIVVSPNMCSLPERGCPGRTYLPSGPNASGKASNSAYSAGSNGRSFLRGKHLHPRAARFDASSGAYSNSISNSPREDDANSTEDDPTPKATPTLYHRPLPPLIPDLSSSSSGSSSSSSSEEEYDVRFLRDSEDLDFSSLHISPKPRTSFRPRTPYSSYPPSPTSPTSPLYGSHPPHPSHPHP